MSRPMQRVSDAIATRLALSFKREVANVLTAWGAAKSKEETLPAPCSNKTARTDPRHDAIILDKGSNAAIAEDGYSILCPYH